MTTWPKKSIMYALKTELRVITALVLRETRATFGTSQLGYFWAVLTPIGSTFVLVAIFTLIGRVAPFGSSMALFFASGVLMIQYFNKLGSSLMTSLEANRALLTYPPIKETDVLIARFLLIFCTYILIMFIFFTGLYIIADTELPAYPDQIIEALAALSLLGFGFGTTNAVLLTLWDSWRHIESILTKPLFFISGIFYVPSLLPQNAINILQWNPVLQAIEWFRSGYYGNYNSTILDKPYLLFVGLCLTFLGLAGERLTRKKRQG